MFLWQHSKTPLWPSTNRGAKVSQLSPQGIQVFQVDNCMTRSFILQADNLAEAVRIREDILNDNTTLIENYKKNPVVFALFDDIHCEIDWKKYVF